MLGQSKNTQSLRWLHARITHHHEQLEGQLDRLIEDIKPFMPEDKRDIPWLHEVDDKWLGGAGPALDEVWSQAYWLNAAMVKAVGDLDEVVQRLRGAE